MHTAWYFIIRMIVAAHFHTVPADITAIDYYSSENHLTASVVHIWEYRFRPCVLYSWDRYDAWIDVGAPIGVHGGHVR